MHKLEIRRQIAHMLYGPILLGLYHYGILTLPILVGMVIGGAGMSYLIKRERLNWCRKILSNFEREHHMENFPARGILFFTLGVLLTLAIFSRQVAYAGILVLSIGDAVSNLFGRHWGKIKTKLNPNKFVEGTLMGIVVSVPIAYYFVPVLSGAIAAASVAMFLEMPNIKVLGFEIDDNLLIPLGAAFTLSLFV